MTGNRWLLPSVSCLSTLLLSLTITRAHHLPSSRYSGPLITVPPVPAHYPLDWACSQESWLALSEMRSRDIQLI
ncbi:hypothetical protein F5B20DRAFT_561717, partial [Whalleya microplaca]